jgi:hypothetical protein
MALLASAAIQLTASAGERLGNGTHEPHARIIGDRGHANYTQVTGMRDRHTDMVSPPERWLPPTRTDRDRNSARFELPLE